jgi:hypothetical protein
VTLQGDTWRHRERGGGVSPTAAVGAGEQDKAGFGEIVRRNGDTVPLQHDVRNACSGIAAWLARILEQRSGAALLILTVKDGIGAINGPELDRRIVEQRRQVRRRQGGIDALDVARVGLFDD